MNRTQGSPTDGRRPVTLAIFLSMALLLGGATTAQAGLPLGEESPVALGTNVDALKSEARDTSSDASDADPPAAPSSGTPATPTPGSDQPQTGTTDGNAQDGSAKDAAAGSKEPTDDRDQRCEVASRVDESINDALGEASDLLSGLLGGEAKEAADPVIDSASGEDGKGASQMAKTLCDETTSITGGQDKTAAEGEPSDGASEQKDTAPEEKGGIIGAVEKVGGAIGGFFGKVGRTVGGWFS